MVAKPALAALAISALFSCSETKVVGGALRSRKDADVPRATARDESLGGDESAAHDDPDSPGGADDRGTHGSDEDIGSGDEGDEGDEGDLGSDDGESDADGGIKTDEDDISVETVEQLISIPAGTPFEIHGVTKPGFIPQLQAIAAGEFNSRYSGGHGLRNEPTTAAEACKKLGFIDGRATAASNWSSPYNETMWHFSGSWQFVKSRSDDKNHIITLECKQTCRIKNKGESNEEKVCLPY